MTPRPPMRHAGHDRAARQRPRSGRRRPARHRPDRSDGRHARRPRRRHGDLYAEPQRERRGHLRLHHHRRPFRLRHRDGLDHGQRRQRHPDGLVGQRPIRPGRRRRSSCSAATSRRATSPSASSLLAHGSLGSIFSNKLSRPRSCPPYSDSATVEVHPRGRLQRPGFLYLRTVRRDGSTSPAATVLITVGEPALSAARRGPGSGLEDAGVDRRGRRRRPSSFHNISEAPVTGCDRPRNLEQRRHRQRHLQERPRPVLCTIEDRGPSNATAQRDLHRDQPDAAPMRSTSRPPTTIPDGDKQRHGHHHLSRQ